MNSKTLSAAIHAPHYSLHALRVSLHAPHYLPHAPHYRRQTDEIEIKSARVLFAEPLAPVVQSQSSEHFIYN